MNYEIVAEQWLHNCDRATKRDGKPLFNGKKWYCSRCEGGYYVDVNGCSQEEANLHFWTYLANVCFARARVTAAESEDTDELSPLLGDFSE